MSCICCVCVYTARPLRFAPWDAALLWQATRLGNPHSGCSHTGFSTRISTTMNANRSGACGTYGTIVVQSHHPISLMPSSHVEGKTDVRYLCRETQHMYLIATRKARALFTNIMRMHTILNQELICELSSICTSHVYLCLGTTDHARRAASCTFCGIPPTLT